MGHTHSFGYWVRRRRKALDLTQTELAQRASCSLELIQKIEADARRPSRQLAEKLADSLRIAADERATFVQAARAERRVDQLALPTQPVEQAAAALPQGTVTFLFTDIEGSTRLWEQYPRAMQGTLTRHDAILADAFTAHSGVVVKSTGDGMLAAFPQAPDALAAALAAQRAISAEQWQLSEPPRMRMALHTGSAEVRANDYFGSALNRAARLLAAGHGGQILLSLATEQLVREHLPPDVSLRDLGTHRLKDLGLPEQIFQLVTQDLPAAFPALNTLDTRRMNLPAQLTTLVGREQEVAAIGTLLRRADVRLVTLTGPGGVGKTRLSLQTAAELFDDFADGVYFVDLAPIRDLNLVDGAIAQTLGVREIGGQPLLERLKDYLLHKQMLLLLDNFEQVIDAAPVVAELLAAAPLLKVLVTSREVLHLRGEKDVPVQPLALPNPAQLPRLDQLSQYAAVALFIERAADARPDFVVTNASAPAVAEVAILDEDPARAEALLAESRTVWQNDGSYWYSLWLGWTLNHLGHAAQLRGEYQRAAELHQESLTNFRSLGDQNFGLPWAYHSLGETALGLGRLDEATSWLAQGLALSQVLSDQACIAWCLAGLGSAVALDEEPERAARLWGAAERLRQALGCRSAPAARATYERALATARAQLGEEAFAVAWAAGQALSLEQAMAEALGDRS